LAEHAIWFRTVNVVATSKIDSSLPIPRIVQVADIDYENTQEINPPDPCAMRRLWKASRGPPTDWMLIAMDQQALMIGTTGIDPSAYFSNAW
jgi:hypothetical protein